MTVTTNIALDVCDKSEFLTLFAKQGDSRSRFVQVSLMANGLPLLVPSESVVMVNAIRIDNASKAFAGVVNEDGTVTVPITNWMLAISDVVLCDVSVVSSDEKLTTFSFAISVESATYDGTPGEDTPDDFVTEVEKHLSDKNNPHGVTAEQIGAVTSKYVDDKVSAITAESIGAATPSYVDSAITAALGVVESALAEV